MQLEKLKILLIGPSESGKTAVANFLSESSAGDDVISRPTQGVRIVEIQLSLNVNDKQCKVDVELWDCSGDHKFESCWPAFRAGVHGVILVCSPNTVNVAAREMELLYNYFVTQAKLSAKQCVVLYNCSEDQDDLDVLNLCTMKSSVLRTRKELAGHASQEHQQWHQGAHSKKSSPKTEVDGVADGSPTFSKVSQVAVNLKTGGNRLKIDFSNYITSVLQSLNKSI